MMGPSNQRNLAERVQCTELELNMYCTDRAAAMQSYAKGSRQSMYIGPITACPVAADQMPSKTQQEHLCVLVLDGENEHQCTGVAKPQGSETLQSPCQLNSSAPSPVN